MILGKTRQAWQLKQIKDGEAIRRDFAQMAYHCT